MGDLYVCLSSLIVILLAIPRCHGALQWIILNSSAHHERGEVASACAIAALLGDVSPKEAMANARTAFRALPLAALTLADLETSDETAPDGADLHARTVPVSLGLCHAFVSHSWRDSAEAKFGALSRWACEHREKHAGQEPLIWLDVRCDADARCLLLP